MRILILSRTPWRKDNSFGNTYSNLFGYMQDAEIANIYLGDGLPDGDISTVISYYRISEKQIVQRLMHFNTGKRVGEEVNPQYEKEKSNDHYDQSFSEIKRKRWNIFFVLREIIWRFGKVDYDGLTEYVKAFDPDIIFLSFYYAAYVDRIALHIKKKMNIPMVLEAAVDIYSMKQISFDPVYWVNRLYIRSMIRKTVRRSEKLYVISEYMKTDYEKMLSIPCSVLYKSPDLSRKKFDYSPKGNDEPLTFLYTGNISSGRWKSLGILGKTLKDAGLGELDIYTPTPMTDRIRQGLKFCNVHPPVSAAEVVNLQNEADVLVHAESFSLRDKLEVRYSISTKVMDYISDQRCILAIGPRDIASMSFLNERGLALCAFCVEEIADLVNMIRDDRSIIDKTIVNIKNYCENSDTVVESCRKLEEDLRKTVSEYAV